MIRPHLDAVSLLPCWAYSYLMADDWTEIIDEPLDLERAIAFVSDARAGGIATFLGTTRGETNSKGQALTALSYEAYREMAASQLNELAKQARQRWPIIKTAILHRIGVVKLADPSVIIAVSTPHRNEAFEACRWLIDTLKEQAAIWKKEVWADGSGTWVNAKSAVPK